MTLRVHDARATIYTTNIVVIIILCANAVYCFLAAAAVVIFVAFGVTGLLEFVLN